MLAIRWWGDIVRGDTDRDRDTERFLSVELAFYLIQLPSPASTRESPLPLSGPMSRFAGEKALLPKKPFTVTGAVQPPHLTKSSKRKRLVQDHTVSWYQSQDQTQTLPSKHWYCIPALLPSGIFSTAILKLCYGEFPVDSVVRKPCFQC